MCCAIHRYPKGGVPTGATRAMTAISHYHAIPTKPFFPDVLLDECIRVGLLALHRTSKYLVLHVVEPHQDCEFVCASSLDVNDDPGNHI